jgi:hypothetical protein
MKKGKKILFVGLIGLLMAAGLVLIGCKDDEVVPAGCSSLGSCTLVSGTAFSGCGDSGCAVDDEYTANGISGANTDCDC